MVSKSDSSHGQRRGTEVASGGAAWICGSVIESLTSKMLQMPKSSKILPMKTEPTTGMLIRSKDYALYFLTQLVARLVSLRPDHHHLQHRTDCVE